VALIELYVTERQDKKEIYIYIDKCKSRDEQKMLWHDECKMFNDLLIEIKERTNLRDFRKMLVQYIRERNRKV